VLALAGVNAAGMVVFAAVYGAAALRSLSQFAFAAALLLAFAGAVVLWVRVERAGAGSDALARLGRIVGGFVVALLAVPSLVLMPLFFLQSQLPPEAGLDHVISRVMVLLVIGLGLTALVNVVGALAMGGALLARRAPRHAPP
jgi:hypothetical protein